MKIDKELFEKLFGEMRGEESYLSLLGQYITIPAINVFYAELKK